MLERQGEESGREEGTCHAGQRGEEGARSEKSHVEKNLCSWCRYSRSTDTSQPLCLGHGSDAPPASLCGVAPGWLQEISLSIDFNLPIQPNIKNCQQ